MKRNLFAALGAVALLVGPLAHAQDIVEIELDQTVEFELAGRSVAFLYVDVPAGTEALRFDLDAVDGFSDLDLLVRSNAPFSRDGGVDVQALLDQSQYRSISPTGDEFVVVDAASRFPAAAGQWHVAAFNFGNVATDARVRVSALDEAPVVPINVIYDAPGQDCDTGPWTQERRAAMDRAAELLTEQIRPRAEVRVRACWNDPESEGTLASAFSNWIFINDLGADNSRFFSSSSTARYPSSLAFLPARYSAFSSPATGHNAGTSLCRHAAFDCEDDFDVTATFNPTADFHYGLDRESPGGSANFISTAMHEITHGLGFYGLLNVENGARITSYEDPYTGGASGFLVGVGSVPLLDMTDEERAAALTSNNVRFSGDATREIVGGSIKLYAPGTPNPGSSFSHLDTLTLRNELMAHSIPGTAPHDLGLALPILYDIGWDPTAKASPEPFLPPSGQYFDPQRDGHGIALYRIAGFEDFYFVVFYSYDDAGLPEYFVANGRMRDGVLVASRNEFGDSLVRSLYDAANNPPNGPDPATAFEGLIRIDFNQAAKSPVCTGNSKPAEGVTSAVVTFTLPGQDFEQWCLQGIAEGLAVQTDLTNIFFNPADPGWGASVLSFPGDGGDGLGMQVYYPDAEGKPRWAIMGTANYQVGGTYDLEQVVGYCRGCPKPATLERVKVGEVTIGLQPVDGGLESTLTFDVSFDGGAGGSFTRDTTVIAGGVPNSGGGE